jgi:hypothetical protein
MVSTINRGMLIGVLVLIAAAGRCGPGDPPVPHGDSGPTAAGSAVAGSDTALARDALERYWEHLSAGEWDDAAGLFGGDWRETAAHWVEPEVADSLSTTGFLARMCGGMLVCDLTLREVLRAEVGEGGDVLLEVELARPDGTRFELGPCCGEEGPPTTAFTYHLQRTGGEFRVMELPIYVP